MARKIEFGAGIAVYVLAVLGLVALLLAPIPVCTVAAQQGCPAQDVRTQHLISARLDAGVWAYVIGMVLFLLLGAAGAIAEARMGWSGGALLLWATTILAFMGCAIGAGGVLGLMYLPAVLALSLAGYASIMPRLRRTQQRRPRPTASKTAEAANSSAEHEPESPSRSTSS